MAGPPEPLPTVERWRLRNELWGLYWALSIGVPRLPELRQAALLRPLFEQDGSIAEDQAARALQTRSGNAPFDAKCGYSVEDVAA